MAFLSYSRRLLSTSAAVAATPFPSGHAFDPSIRRLARLRRFSDIESLLEPLKTSPAASTAGEPFLASLLVSYASSGMLDHALRTLHSLPSLGVAPTALSLNALLSACNHHSSLFRRVPDLFSDILKTHSSISPDKVSYGCLVKAHCRAHKAQNAFPILREMESKGIEVTAVTYTTIIDSLYKENKPQEAERLWREMIGKGIEPDLPAYNVRVMYQALNGKPDGVLKLIEEMEAKGLKPDVFTYNYFITCYCNHRKFEDARRVYKEMREKGCAANSATVRNLVTALCKAGKFDAGLEVYNDGLKMRKVPDLGSVKLLVEGLVKEKRVRVAKGVVTRLRKKFPDDFVGEWKKLEKVVGLDREGEAEEQEEEEAA